MTHGGSRPGAGAKRGSKQKALTPKERVKELVKASAGGGLMPHEILLKAARGESFRIKKLVITCYKSGPNKGQEKSREWEEQEYVPSYAEQIDAAKAAAPYFAPRLATQMVKTDARTADALTGVMKELAGKLPG